ncbi:hypothetical protein [Microbacterium phyllosphaerae]|uniref:hypothetical protein n=1 Tax=Microbacterium phyllosphaerae TaxID=124798 RepID=UPI003D650B19
MIERAPALLPRTTFILGAGFSKAVSATMPITDELGRHAISSLSWADGGDIPAFSNEGITFESWLTWLSERQPYLSEAEHLRDRARFAELSGALAAVLRTAQQPVTASGGPGWLAQFVDTAHWMQSDIVTLNYDTIIEETIRGGVRFDGDTAVLVDDVVTGIPNSRGVFQGKATGFVDRDTLRLHKLHGSVDWFSVPGDVTGMTLDRIEVDTATPSRAHQAMVGGREVFIVPPTSSKGGYFDNPRTRFVWQQAREALVTAERVVLAGYSLPLTDTALARLLTTTLATGVQEIVVVNPDGDGVRDRVRALGVDSSRIRVVDGMDGVERFVAAEIAALSAALAKGLHREASENPTRPVAVGWHDRWGAVTDVHRDSDGSITLTIDDATRPLNFVRHPEATDPAPDWSRPTVTLGEVVGDTAPERLVVRWGERIWPIAARMLPSYPFDEDWVLLRPAGAHPNPHA